MLRRALLTLLALTEATTLLAAVHTVNQADHAPAAPVRVHSADAVAPSPLVVTSPDPVRIAAPKPRSVTRRSAPAKVRTPVARPKVRVTVTRRPTPRLTGKQLMLASVARIPGYQAGTVRWVMSSKYGSWGTADWYRGVIYISPSVPDRRMYDVVAHEWSHLRSVQPYDSVSEATAAMNRVFGGSGLTGAERAADCMARLLRATWTHYTGCQKSDWRKAAARLLAGRPA